jgi:hypothetical protein
VIVPDDDGEFTVRKQQGGEGGRVYPYVLVPQGDGKPISCTITGTDAAVVQHEVTDGQLTLLLSERVQLTVNKTKGDQ